MTTLPFLRPWVPWRSVDKVQLLRCCNMLTEYQIMDPKMDSGFLADGETLEDDYDVLRKLLPEEVIGIIDQLLCFEVRAIPEVSIETDQSDDADGRGRRWHGT